MSLWVSAALVAAFVASAPVPATANEVGGEIGGVDVKWSEGPEYPMGIQDSAFGVVGGLVVSAGGFTRHPKDVVKRYPDAFGGARDGFTALTFVFDPANPTAGWIRISDIPGPPRQATLAVVVGNALYAIGGFNYTAPYTYQTTYRLSREQDRWSWTNVGADVPWPVCQGGAVAIGSKIYVVAAADYFAPSGVTERNFFTEAGRGQSPVGRALLVLDTRNAGAGWKRLADLPGVSRAYASVGAVAGKIYVLGGLHAPLRSGATGGVSDLNEWYFNAEGNWRYDPPTDRWDPLAPTRDNANSRAVVVSDRYLVLLGGYKYSNTWSVDGTRSYVYSSEETLANERQRTVDAAMGAPALMRAEVSVYDTVTGRQASLSPLLDPSAWPMGVADGNSIYCLGGEGGKRLWHPATFQIGRLELPASRQATR
ncbi:MAG: hypothetical protein JNN01_13895 [Opitutaceae bacterium]|nr:hypothetical protein [Opitutaceae bacterium]